MRKEVSPIHLLLVPALMASVCAAAPSPAPQRKVRGPTPPRLSQQSADQLEVGIAALDQLHQSILLKMQASDAARRSGGDPKKVLTQGQAQGLVSQRIEILMNEAKLLISLAQARMDKKASPAPNLFEPRPMEHAEKILTEFIEVRDPVLRPTDAQFAQAYRLRGMTFFYRDDYSSALKDFEASIKLDTASSDSLWTAFMAAEEHFEQSNFLRASELYQLVASRAAKGARSRELARYKLAWCWINLSKFSEAEAIFSDLASGTGDEALALDAARDLAFVITRVRNEKQILAMYDQRFANSKVRGLAFLKKALATMESQGKLASNSPLRERVLQLEGDATAKVTIQLDSIQSVAREYASLEHVGRVLEVMAIAENIAPEKREPLEVASERVIRIFTETYAGRIKSPEAIDKALIAGSLQKLFSEHLRVFPATRKKDKLYAVWFDVCESEKDGACLYRISEAVLNDLEFKKPDLKPLRRRALDLRLVGLDILNSSTETGEYLSRFKDALKERLMDPEARDRALAGAKLSQLFINEKRFEDAAAILNAVLKIEPSQEYWYRLKWSQLQGSDYKRVLESPQSLGIQALSGNPDPRLAAVLAEASIKLATLARESGDLDQMGTHLARFEQVSTDRGKVDLARDEWVSALLAKKAYPEVLRKMGEFGPEWARRTEATAIRSRLLHELLDTAHFEFLPGLLKQWPLETRPRQEAQALLLAALYAGGPKSVGREGVRGLEPAQRDVWLSSAVLTAPQWVQGYFKLYPPANSAEKELLALAAKVAARDLAPEARPKTLAPATSFEKSASAIVFPLGRKMPEARYTAAVQSAISGVKASRERVTPALKGQPVEVQLRILAKQRDLESKASSSITQAPVPKGLQGADLEQYRDGLRQLASEFDAQVKEIALAEEKIRVSDRETTAAREAEEKTRTLLPLADPSFLLAPRWLAREQETGGVARLVEAGNPWGAIMELERLRGGKLIDGEDYWRLRTWLLLSIEGAPTHRTQGTMILRYLYDELNDAGMKAIIEECRRRG